MIVEPETAQHIGRAAYFISLVIGLSLAAYFGRAPRWPQ